MDDTSTPVAGLREHYQRLLDGSRLRVGLCWTVVIPDDGRPFTLDEIAARRSGETHHQVKAPVMVGSITPFDDEYPVYVDQIGSATVLLEHDHPGTAPSVLERLSVGATVYNAWWSVNFHNNLNFAVGGEHLLMLDGIFPYLPENLRDAWPELHATSDLFVDFEKRDDDYDVQAVFLALIEQTTGAGLTREWLDRPHPYVSTPLQ